MPKKQRKLEFDDIFSGTCGDYSLAAEQPELVKAIITTLSNVKATLEQKQEFACEVVSEMPYVIADAEDKHGFPIWRDAIIAEISKAKESLSAYYQLLIKHRAGIKGNLDAAHAMNPRITKDVDIKRVLAYFDQVKAALGNVKARERKQRQDMQSIIGQSVAEFLHEQFKKHFSIKPQSGKGRRPYGEEITRDYDNLCKLLNEEYKIKISKSTKIGFKIPATATK
jgi:hypothetical protein